MKYTTGNNATETKQHKKKKQTNKQKQKTMGYEHV
jgi:hypothetical protein